MVQSTRYFCVPIRRRPLPALTAMSPTQPWRPDPKTCPKPTPRLAVAQPTQPLRPARRQTLPALMAMSPTQPWRLDPNTCPNTKDTPRLAMVQSTQSLCVPTRRQPLISALTAMSHFETTSCASGFTESPHLMTKLLPAPDWLVRRPLLD